MFGSFKQGAMLRRFFPLVMTLIGIGGALAACSGVNLSNGKDVSALAGEAFGDGKPEKVYIPPAKRKPPTLAELMRPGPLPENTLGRRDAPVTVIEYVSHTCPYSRAFHQKTFAKFKRAYIDTGKVYFILREFPIGRTSGTASIINKCAPKEKYFKLLHAFMMRQNEWVSQQVRLDKIFKIGKSVGLSTAQMRACLNDKKLVEGLREVKQRGREFGVFGTPTFFVNGEQLRGIVTLKELKAKIDPLLG